MPSDDRTLIQPDLCPRAGDAEVPSGLPAETRIQPDQDQAPGDEVLSGAHRGTSVRGTSDAAQVELDDSGPGMTPRLSGEAEDQARRRSLGVPQVPDYDVKTLLGKGAFGEVWLAVERRTGKRVAIKFFSHGTGEQWESLQAEVKQLAHLNSDPGIVQLIDFEPDPRPLPSAPRPRPYYVMTLAERGSLAERLKGGPLPLEEALALFRQIAEALAYVHVKGIRHCDLKPANILLDARGRAWIADFGQAHLSCDASPALGTFYYMAPEQANHCNQIPDTRWDVYGLGAIFYAMLTGHPPRETTELQAALKGNTGLSERLRSYRELAKSASTPTAHRRVRGMDRLLAEIIDHCLAIDPERRWRDAGAVLSALERRNRRRRQRPLLALGFVAPVVLLLSMILSTLLIRGRANETQQKVIDQLLEVNLENVKMVATMLDEQFSNRLTAQAHAPPFPISARPSTIVPRLLTSGWSHCSSNTTTRLPTMVTFTGLSPTGMAWFLSIIRSIPKTGVRTIPGATGLTVPATGTRRADATRRSRRRTSHNHS